MGASPRKNAPVALINPNLIAQRDDVFTTGIVYMPVCLAYAAASLRASGRPVEVIDAFGENPRQVRERGAFLVQGLRPEEVLARVPADCLVACVYAINATSHDSTLEIVRALKRARLSLTVGVLENTQAVTAYALAPVAHLFYEAGADHVITGEPERRLVAFVEAVERGDRDALRAIDGVGGAAFYNPPLPETQDLDRVPFPAWELFPLENYWKLGHAHGPFESRRYLPILTSRGCPYPCRFCVIPETTGQKWRARSASNVVDEMAEHARRFGVHEFHVEDLNPTVSDARTRAMCEEIIRRRLDVTWKLAAGTKVETIKDEDTVTLMARAGCRYISISPETGSERIVKAIGKPLNVPHTFRLVRHMNAVGIRSQACFVLGFPGETDEDRRKTETLVHDLVRQGVDEIALFIITPAPGSAIYDHFKGYGSLSQLTFSPTWRPDYRELNRFRLKLYAKFLLWKLRHHPMKLLVQPLNFLVRRFQTKMEMVPFRALTITWRGLWAVRESSPEYRG